MYGLQWRPELLSSRVRLELEVLGQPRMLCMPKGLIMDRYQPCSTFSELISAISCQSSHYCGNAAITARHDGIREIPMCESCAAEYDEQ
jgi:hypothetical protein